MKNKTLFFKKLNTQQPHPWKKYLKKLVQTRETMLARTYTTQYPGSTVIMYKSDLIILHTFHITKETHLDSKTKKKIPVLRQEGELPRHAHTRERTAGVHTRTWTNERLCSDHSRVERMGRVDEVTHRHMLQKQSARDLRKIFTSDWFKTS